MLWNEYVTRVFAIGATGAAVLAATIESIETAGAQGYPSRPITMVVPFAAGGAADTLARTVADRMRASLGQPIVIENERPARCSSRARGDVENCPQGERPQDARWSAPSSSIRSKASHRLVATASTAPSADSRRA